MIQDVLINSMFKSKMTDSRPSELVQFTGKSFCILKVRQLNMEAALHHILKISITKSEFYARTYVLIQLLRLVNHVSFNFKKLHKAHQLSPVFVHEKSLNQS